MEHFQGANNQERFNNDLLSEMRQIRQLLERIAQTSEPKQEENADGPKSGFQRTTSRKRNAQ